MTTQYSKITDLPLFIGHAPGSSVMEMVSGTASYQITMTQVSGSNPADLPAGGLTGQGLLKASSADYDTYWAPLPGVGTVISVGLAMPSSVFSVAGSPITTSGTATASFVTQGPHLVFAGPTSGTSTPTFRALVASDIPSSAINLTIGTTPLSGGVAGRVLYDTGTTLGEYLISGTGSVAMNHSAQLTNPSVSGTASFNYRTFFGTGTPDYNGAINIINDGTSELVLQASASGGGSFINHFGSGGLFLQSASALNYYVNTSTQAWQMNSSGHLVTPTDNTYDIGASGTTRPRNLYIAGNGAFGGTITSGTWNGTAIAVSYGGTGTSTLAANGIPYGNGTSQLLVTSAAANSVLVTNASNVPSLSQTLPLSVQQNITTLGITVFGTGTWNGSTIGVAYGGTGTSTLAVYGLVYGNGTANVGVTSGAANSVLVTSPTNVPSLSQTLPLAVQQNQTTVGTIASGVWNGTAVTVPFGGTGATSLTAHGVVIGEGTASVAVSSAMSGGQLLVGQTTTSDPVPRSISGDITLSSAGTATIATNAVGTTKIAQFAGLSVIGVTGTASGNIGAITGAANQALFVNSGATALSFGLLPLATSVTGTLPIANGGTAGTTVATALSNLGAVSLTGTSQALSAGFTVTPYNIGTASSGTVTVNYGSGTMQRLINNGAFTLASPATDGETDLLVTNGASASTITISGFSVGSNTGDTYGTTSGNKFFFMSRTANSSSTYAWKALQ